MEIEDIKSRISGDLPNLLPGIKIRKITTDKRFAGYLFDIAIYIETKRGVKRLLLGEVKRLVQPRMAREISRQLKESSKNIKGSYPVIISSFLSKRVREICHEMEMGFLDLAGNCYLRFNNIYIEKIVDKNPFAEPRPLKTIFNPVSSRVLRAVLEEPKRKWKIAELAKTTRVSLGQTYNVCQKLLVQEYLRKSKDRSLSLSDPGKLLEEWRENYSFRENEGITYYSFEKTLSALMNRIAKLGEDERLSYAFTLHSGASLIAPFVRGISTAQFYISTKTDLPKWRKALDLRPVESGGNVYIMIPYDIGVFYKTQIAQGIKIVGDIQLYLDLYKSPARGREQAEFLRRQKIKF